MLLLNIYIPYIIILLNDQWIKIINIVQFLTLDLKKTAVKIKKNYIIKVTTEIH